MSITGHNLRLVNPHGVAVALGHRRESGCRKHVLLYFQFYGQKAGSLFVSLFLSLFLCFFLLQDFFFLDFIYLFIFRQRGREEKERERNSMCGCLSCTPHWGPVLAHNPGICPDWELNQQHFGLQASTQSTEPHQPGPDHPFL